MNISTLLLLLLFTGTTLLAAGAKCKSFAAKGCTKWGETPSGWRDDAYLCFGLAFVSLLSFGILLFVIYL